MLHERWYYVYIMASHKNGSLYTGMTNDLIRRVEEHKLDKNPKSHTSRYNIKRLVYFEIYDNPEEAIAREKFVKPNKVGEAQSARDALAKDVYLGIFNYLLKKINEATR